MTPDKSNALANAPSETRALALALLDEISRPLTLREIERALRDAGNSRSWSARMAPDLARLNIIAITAKEA